MPRITPKEQYRRHEFLRMLLEDPSLHIFFGLLSINAQMEIHQFYKSSLDMTESEFIDHVKYQNQIDPSLRHRAGKHYKFLEEAFVIASRAYGADDKMIIEAVSNCASKIHSSHDKSNESKRMTAPSKTGDMAAKKRRSSVSVIPIVRAEIDVEKLGRVLIKLAEKLNEQNSK